MRNELCPSEDAAQRRNAHEMKKDFLRNCAGLAYELRCQVQLKAYIDPGCFIDATDSMNTSAFFLSACFRVIKSNILRN